MIRRAVAGAMAAALVAALAVVAVGRLGGPDSNPTCAGADAIDFGCQARRFVALTEQGGAQAALRDLARAMKGSGYLRGACHQLVHRIGRVAGAHAGMRAFADGDPLCASGYYHGVTEAVMRRMGPRDAVREARAVCTGLRGRDGDGDEATCLHGMGHGFMHVLERDIRAALSGCDELFPAGARRECYSGVFMENHAGAEQPARDSLRPREPLYPCTALVRRYKPACYGRQTTYALFVNNGDFAAVFRLCGGTERDFRAACRRGLGGDVAAETEDVAPLAEQARARHDLCLLGRDRRARTDCVRGVVEVVLRDRDGDPTAQLDAFCRALESLATQPEHAACLRAAEAGYRQLLSRQTGSAAAPARLDFVCHLKPRGGGRSSR